MKLTLIFIVIALGAATVLVANSGGFITPWAAVGSFSMEPTMEVGTLVILCPVHVGSLLNNIVVYLHDGEYIVHRVIYVGNGFVETKGDANPVRDPWLTPFNEVEGMVCLAIPYWGLFSLMIRNIATLLVFAMLTVAMYSILATMESSLKRGKGGSSHGRSHRKTRGGRGVSS
ncbi:MAG: signal peptidase I [Thermocladium sp.]